jgi:hypothetical protein
MALPAIYRLSRAAWIGRSPALSIRIEIPGWRRHAPWVIQQVAAEAVSTWDRRVCIPLAPEPQAVNVQRITSSFSVRSNVVQICWQPSPLA